MVRWKRPRWLRRNTAPSASSASPARLRFPRLWRLQRDGEAYSVYCHGIDGQRVRHALTSQDTAIAEAENLLRSCMSGNSDRRGMSDMDWLIYNRSND